MKTTLKFIGHINTPYNSIEECPNNIDSNGPLCKLVVNDDYKEGLLGLEIGQEILILYWFENTGRSVTQQESSNREDVIGTFALRSPHRPNPIAVAVLPIEAIDKGELTCSQACSADSRKHFCSTIVNVAALRKMQQGLDWPGGMNGLGKGQERGNFQASEVDSGKISV